LGPIWGTNGECVKNKCVESMLSINFSGVLNEHGPFIVFCMLNCPLGMCMHSTLSIPMLYCFIHAVVNPPLS